MATGTHSREASSAPLSRHRPATVSIDITLLQGPSPSDSMFEIVERKGFGHPDTLCDALADNLSIALSRWYLDRFGVVLHHNVDKALLCGGASRPAFRGGRLLEPIEIYLGGRATRRFRDIEIPVDELAIEATREWLARHVPTLDAVRDVRIHPKLRPASCDLAELFVRQQATGVALANDSSLGVAFAPLDELEATVLGVERDLHRPELKRMHPEIGDDIKLMGVRRGSRIDLTLACAFIDRHIEDLADYRRKKALLAERAMRCARAWTPAPVQVAVNGADGETADSLYLTVTGLSAEAGDDGQVGRGNRINGLITPYRPMSLEAVAGKNPVSHVGKLYNILAQRIARDLLANLSDVREVQCFLASQIGRPVTEPLQVDVKVRLADHGALIAHRAQALDIIQAHLKESTTLWRDLISESPASPEVAAISRA
jgi:S-adenosylmethionine synthetase